jgi:hypothetical protein
MISSSACCAADSPASSSTLHEGGRATAVIERRMEFRGLMRARFTSVIEDATGRQVVGFMSGNQQEPDIMCEVFILAASDLLDGDDLTSREHPPS